MRLHHTFKRLLSLTVFLALFTALCLPTFADTLASDVDPTWQFPLLASKIELNGVEYDGTITIASACLQLYDVSALEPGSYTFRVKIQDSSELWSEWSTPITFYKRGTTWRGYPYSGGSERQSTGQR